MSVVLGEGGARKMRTALTEASVDYALPLGDASVGLNALLGQSISLVFLGAIHCVHCGRKTKKSFNQGYCYPCFQRLAQCDSCIMSPQKCHYAAGTCREPEWGEANCMVDHFVYLANTSGLKVGITRGTQVPTRWIDQGATQALPAFRVASRLDSGLVEVLFASHVADKTAWQRMLKGASDPLDLPGERARLNETCAEAITQLQQLRGIDAITALDASDVTDIDYPVLEYPEKVKSMTFDKMPEVAGTLLGIKGQYLILDTGVINMRRHAGYQIALSQMTES
ncbi:MAG: DUF2797 domain-containing protein [Congregibacter sp.]|nr:DUF2797 domain-containing protein [Congregibacter sp.]MDP5070606.1 DUF2797 domain-containing protein [Congregibacter sp.]